MNVNDVSEIKLEKGNKATPWSPYGMGSINEKISNKNWFNKNGNFKTYNATVTPIDTGIKVENNDGGTYRSVWCEIGKDELLGKTLTIQTSISTYNGAIPRIIVVFNNETAQYIAQIKTITDTTEGTLVNIPNSFPENADRVSLIFYCSFTSATPKGSYVEYKDLQVELGSTATPYVEHKEQDYSIFVQQPRRSIGDVRDLFFKNVKGSKYYNKDLEENKWYERHYIGRYIFTGKEYFSTLSQGIYRFNAKANNIDTKVYDNNVIANALSNHFIIETSNHIVNGSSYDGHFAISSTGTFDFNVQKFASATEFKNWLAEKYANGNPVYADYILETPLDLPCTEEQIQQLENLPSTYKDFTIIQSEDETPAYLEVAGIYDLNKLINN